MATDYISREAAIETVINYDFENCPDYMRDWATKLKSAVCSDIRTDLAAIPAADVRPAYYAEWERSSESTPRSWIFRCSKCKDRAYYPVPKGHVARCGYKYCPNCGADMRTK